MDGILPCRKIPIGEKVKLNSKLTREELWTSCYILVLRHQPWYSLVGYCSTV